MGALEKVACLLSVNSALLLLFDLFLPARPRLVLDPSLLGPLIFANVRVLRCSGAGSPLNKNTLLFSVCRLSATSWTSSRAQLVFTVQLTMRHVGKRNDTFQRVYYKKATRRVSLPFPPVAQSAPGCADKLLSKVKVQKSMSCCHTS